MGTGREALVERAMVGSDLEVLTSGYIRNSGSLKRLNAEGSSSLTFRVELLDCLVQAVEKANASDWLRRPMLDANPPLPIARVHISKFFQKK